jgi:predicted RNA binding protein YcfA (HicA-like mRNA interferase family)
MNLNPKYLIKILEQYGFIFKRSKGSHQLYFNPDTYKTVIVPVHGGKDMKKGTFLAILKQAGIDKTTPTTPQP